jgi:hypothetical protein
MGGIVLPQASIAGNGAEGGYIDRWGGVALNYLDFCRNI